MEFRCIHCGFPSEKLMVQYSPGNIRLAKCENCRAITDEYIECEIMIVLIDLILHKKKAYRHLLFNVPKHHAIDFEGILWKLMIIFLLLDLFQGRNLILYNTEETARNSFPSIWLCGKILIQVFAGNFAFFSTLFIALKLFHGFPSHASRCKEVLLAIVISSYLRTFIITMMCAGTLALLYLVSRSGVLGKDNRLLTNPVWEFPSLMLFIIDIFVLSSNAVALKVLTQLTIATCVGVCLSAHTARLIASHVLWGSASFQF